MASLEQRVAAALADPELGSESLVKLIAEVEEAAQQAEAAAVKARADALDPAAVIDVMQVSAKVTTAELMRDRLQVALPKLQQLLSDVRARKIFEAWAADFDKVKAGRDALAAELAERYPAIVAELVDYMLRIAAVDREVDRVNGSRPLNASGGLKGVEAAARGVDGFGPNGLLSLMTELKLPKFFADDDRYQYSWPPPQPSLAAQMASAPVPRGIAGPDWHLLIDERDRQRREESERLSAFYEKEKREAEKRREAELREAREAHRREYGY